MPNRILSEYSFGDMTVKYIADDAGHVGFCVLPASRADEAVFNFQIEPLVQLYLRGDSLPSGFGAGLTLSESGTTALMVCESHECLRGEGETTVRTVLCDGRGHRAVHLLTHTGGRRAVEIRTIFENASGSDAVLEMISSFSLGMLSPFGGADRTNRMILRRARSWWSAEGRIESEGVEESHLTQSWSMYGIRNERFGQVGSMPVRKYFPFLSVEDAEAGVTWAVQLGCPSSWQMEFRRCRETLSVTGGLADYEYGHWMKTVRDGESFGTPAAFVTVGVNGFDDTAQRLLDCHNYSDNVAGGDGLPLVYNEWCTSWGHPTEDSVKAAVERLKDKNVDYFIIDAGWFCDGDWGGRIGDWKVEEKLFPNGIKKAADIIREAGITPGIWFEMENVGLRSETSGKHELLLKRHGVPVMSGRMFLDMKTWAAKDYLREKMIALLRDNGFGYVKIDYNDSIGLGCDDEDGLGEGLRKSLLATQDFMREIHEKVPGIVIENCSSGGHRLEPSFMNICDMASFSDAHESVFIPVIAANLQRLIQPAKSQIWSVLHRSDSLKRINYSLVNTLLGVMCISGEVHELTPEQWEIVDRAIAFYRKYSPVIKSGTSSFFGDVKNAYLSPEGWQAVVRRGKNGRTLAVIHTFGGEHPSSVSLPVSADRILDVLCTENNSVSLSGGRLNVTLNSDFEAVAVAME